MPWSLLAAVLILAPGKRLAALSGPKAVFDVERRRELTAVEGP